MVESRINLTVEFAPNGDTPDWSAEEIARRVGNFLSVELESVVKAKVQSAFMGVEVIDVTPDPIVLEALRQAGIR
jgi:hypothetical protein